MEPAPSRIAAPGPPVTRDELLGKLRERIVGFAASRVQRDAAEDIAQEVLLLLEQKYARLDRIEDLLPLALQIVRFKILALRRKSVRRGEFKSVSAEDTALADPGASPALAAERRQLRDRLIAAIAQMGERCRRMFALKLEGKSFAEIQLILKAASINTVYAWDFRCRKQLLERMGGEGR
jgi:RNA polymerase sigma-70 factor (ECF subfamily)